jgi:hypothetical protein
LVRPLASIVNGSRDAVDVPEIRKKKMRNPEISEKTNAIIRKTTVRIGSIRLHFQI